MSSRTEDTRTTAPLGVSGFEIIRTSDAAEEYGEDGKNGVIVIFTRRPAGNAENDGAPGDPPS